MAYIGKSIESGTFSVLDTSGNTYNGSNVTFSLGTQVGSPAQLLVSHDGVIQKPGTDYTLATGGTQITFTTAPASGASIFIVEISGAVGGPLDSDLNGTELILDADADTSITADTDDQIDIRIGGSDRFKFDNSGHLSLLTDSGAIKFGADSDVTLTHDPDDGLFFKSAATADDNPVLLTLQTGETDLAADDVIGKISFQAPDEGTGTDAILVSAAIQAVAEGDHSSSSNATSLQFMTGASEAAAEKVRIDSAGRVGIGNTAMGSYDANGKNLVVGSHSGSNGITVACGSSGSSNIMFSTGTSGDQTIKGRIRYNESDNHMGFYTDGDSERLRIDSSGNVFIAKTGQSATTVGIQLEADGQGIFTAGSTEPIYINRQTDDGNLVSLRQADSQEGTITVSGSTVAYNTFCGTHWSRLADNSKPTILRGTVIESITTMMTWYQAVATDDGIKIVEDIALPDGKSAGDAVTFTSNGKEYTGVYVKEDNEQLPMCKISDTADSKAVYGVFMTWDDHDDGLDGDVNDMHVASLGAFVVRIHKDETVAIGDYLQSKGDGTAKKQADDILRASTIAKVTSTTKTHEYADGSYCVPCTLHCG
jgi:hypothetical protein